MSATASEKLAVARTALVLDQPFFGALLMRLKMVEDKSCDTMWTDGVSIGYNPAFVEEINIHELQGVLCHELLHAANGHTWRRDSRDPKRWNDACDYSINPIIIDDAKLQLPKGGLLDYQYKGMSVEQIFSSLQQEPKENDDRQQSGGSGSGNDAGNPDPNGAPCDKDDSKDFVPGEVRDLPDPDAKAEMESEWKMAITQAAKAAQMQGKLPGSLQRLVEETLHEKADWRSILHRFIQQVARNDYSWNRPNSRYTHMGMYLPSLHSEEMGAIVVAIDTSGSINEVALAQVESEINGIVSEMQPEAVHVIYVDAKMHRADEFMRNETVIFNPVGGGGTDFRPAFDWVDEMAVNPVCMIYFTDLMGAFPEQAPEYPVLWATTEKSVAPFGETVRIE